MSVEIASARLTEERLRWLEAVTDAGLAQLTVDRLLDELLDKVRELMAVDTAAVLLLDPSRQNIPHYAAYLEEIQSVVRTVNRRFGSDAWQPIVLVVQDDFPRSLAAYKRYDVLFVNAIFDGMNLVAKEAPLVNERDGVLLLSENTGAHEELAQWSVVVNPFDVVGQAEAIHAALELSPADRRARMEAIRAHVREHDIESWLSAQLADLDAVSPVARS